MTPLMAISLGRETGRREGNFYHGTWDEKEIGSAGCEEKEILVVLTSEKGSGTSILLARREGGWARVQKVMTASGAGTLAQNRGSLWL